MENTNAAKRNGILYVYHLLESNTCDFKESFEIIAHSIGMDLLKEETRVYLSVEKFIVEIDVNDKKVKIEFIESLDKEKYNYLETYLQCYLHKLHYFYALLKYFVFYVNNANLKESLFVKTEGEKRKTSFCCNCILDGNYCSNTMLEGVTNIFTHSSNTFVVNNSNIFIEMENEKEANLSQLYIDSVINKDLFNFGFKDQCFYEDSDITIKNGNVFLKSGKNKPLSFLFHKGQNIKDIKKCIKLLNFSN